MPDFPEFIWGLTVIGLSIVTAVFSFFSALVLVQHAFGIQLFTGI